MANRVLITGARAPAALDLARGFAAAGFAVHFADSRPGLMPRWSGLAEACHLYAPPALSPTEFRQDIKRLTDDLRPDLIVPVCEEVFHLRQAAEATGLSGTLLAPSSEVLSRLHSKARFADLCTELGLPVPDTRRVVSRAALTAAMGDLGEQVFKAEYSRFGAEVLVGPSAEALSRIHPTEARAWVVQQRIRGREACFHAVAVGGRLTAFSAYRSPWRMPDGAGYAFAPLDVPTSARLLSMGERLAQVVGTGQFACDLIIDAQDRPWLIECNPRATSGVHLFGGAAGLAKAMTGDIVHPVIGEERGHLGPAMWRYGLPSAIRRGQLREWSLERRQAADVITRGAGRAALGAVLDSLGYSVEALRRGCRLEQAMTRDIEWNGPGGDDDSPA